MKKIILKEVSVLLISIVMVLSSVAVIGNKMDTSEVKAGILDDGVIIWHVSDSCFMNNVFNDPPGKPSLSGPTEADIGETLTFSATTVDPDGDDVYYYFDWVDTTNSGWIGPYQSGVSVSASHSYVSQGTYCIKVKAKDIYGNEGSWSDPLCVNIGSGENNPPNMPSKPSGPTTGKPEIEYTYTTSTTDPDGDMVKYGWEWTGDNMVDGWTNFYSSGATSSVKLVFDKEGTYYIKVKAEDEHGAQSQFSAQLMVVISMGDDEQPDLYCDGSLFWTDITPGLSVYGNFSISNIGGINSLLSWEISSFPDWGSWSFTPSNGMDLSPEDGGVVVDVFVTSPYEENQSFSGQIIIVNNEDSNDSCEIEVTLKTARDIFSGVKWNQPPSCTGILVDTHFGDYITFADDFLCTSPGLITNITIWGAYSDWNFPVPMDFTLSIYSDDPDDDGPGPDFSKPDKMLWQKSFNSLSYKEKLYKICTATWFYDPYSDYLWSSSNIEIKQFDFNIDPCNAFFQNGSDEGGSVVYWLVVKAGMSENGAFHWMTSETHWNDDAVYWTKKIGGEWKDLFYPHEHPKQNESIDMAFRLRTYYDCCLKANFYKGISLNLMNYYGFSFFIENTCPISLNGFPHLSFTWYWECCWSTGGLIDNGFGSDFLGWGLGKSYFSGQVGTPPILPNRQKFLITLTIIDECKCKTVIKASGIFLFWGYLIKIN